METDVKSTDRGVEGEIKETPQISNGATPTSHLAPSNLQAAINNSQAATPTLPAATPTSQTNNSQNTTPTSPQATPTPKITPPPPHLTLPPPTSPRLLFHFTKTFVSVMESTIFSSHHHHHGTSSSPSSEDEADEYCDDFFYSRYSSYPALDPSHRTPISDEEFAFEKYFPADQKPALRDIFITTAFDLFTSYEYQLVILVREKRKIGEIGEDIVHRILDNFKESQRGINPEYVRPEITPQLLIELALQHSEPEGITYNSEWSAVEVLENPGILIPGHPGSFYRSDWQKNFIGVKKKIGSKYGFRLKFGFETELSILRWFEKVPISVVYPPYARYEYVIDDAVKTRVRSELEKEIELEEKMKRFGIRFGDEERDLKDKVKEFQIKLQIQRQEEDRNSDIIPIEVFST